jgi:hypothetical protein
MFALLVSSFALTTIPELNNEAFEPLRDAIRPREEELVFLKINWHASFHVAVNEAKAADRPILLWAMNGHPLGCT